MTPTKLIYLEDYQTLERQARVLEVGTENDRDFIVLDETIFYAQGGGQPCDQGTISVGDSNFIVENVRFIDGIIKHYGRFTLGNFAVEDTVVCRVNPERRQHSSRIHSAGHVVDMAVWKLQLGWIPGKGYHFPDGPYVEYTGNLDGLDKDKIQADIERICNNFIVENLPIHIAFMDKEKMKQVCHHVPDHLPEGKPLRVVQFGEPKDGQAFGIPDGGTHVPFLKELDHITIRKISVKGPNVRVSYEIPN